MIVLELIEIKGDLFTTEPENYLVHCIARDCQLGRGIAVEFQKRFNLRKQLKAHKAIKHSNCILIGKVFNLITKELSYEKPTYNSMAVSLNELRKQVIAEEIKHLAIPKIGCGLDGLNWELVKNTLYEQLGDLDIGIKVYYL